jgi:uncharacterized protein (TIGR03067 family)
MTWLLAAGLLVGLQQPPPDMPDDEKVKEEELKKLEGPWSLVSGEKNGEKLTDEQVKKYRLVITAKDKDAPKIEAFETASPAKPVLQTVFKIDPITKPNDPARKHKTIDLLRYDGGQELTMPGIYELKGDTLTICGCDDGRRIRPTAFAAKADSGCSLLVLKREKKSGS